MNIVDLLIIGIEVQLARDDKFVADGLIFRFRKGDAYFQRIVKQKELIDFNGGSTVFEDMVCQQVIEYFESIKKQSPSLHIDDWVICTDTGVVGRIIKFYTPTACEEQIMVMTRNGRKYHAPARMWKPYQFGTSVSQVCVDEFATQPSSLLNAHGQYAAKFAANHGISINEAMEHQMVRAHKEYLNAVENERKENTLRRGGII